MCTDSRTHNTGNLNCKHVLNYTYTCTDLYILLHVYIYTENQTRKHVMIYTYTCTNIYIHTCTHRDIESRSYMYVLIYKTLIHVTNTHTHNTSLEQQA